VKHTLINTSSFETGKAEAKKLVSDYRLVESYSELFEPDLFESHKPFICLMLRPPTALEIKEIEHIQREVIFVAEKLAVSHAFLQWIKKNGKLIDLAAEAPWQKQKRVEARIRAEVTHIEPEALKALLELPEEQVDSEIEKLLTYNPHITLEAVQKLVPTVPNATIWAFLDALLQRDAKRALSLPLSGQESLFGLVKMVRGQQKNLTLMKSVPAPERRVLLAHLKDRHYAGLETALPKFTKEQLQESLCRLDRLDFMMRDGLVDDTLIITLIVSYIC
jgi:DNA polymerase III delta subunit